MRLYWVAALALFVCQGAEAAPGTALCLQGDTDCATVNASNPLPTALGGAGTGTDGSANAPALAANTLKTIAANPNRVGFYVQNQSADTLQVVLDDGVGTATVILIDPGAGANKQGGDWSLAQAGIRHTGRIRILGPSATDQVAAREY